MANYLHDDGTLISSGTHSVTVYPQVPVQGADVVSITWNSGACSWDISPNNDCDLLDIGSVFTISPDPNSIAPYCSDSTESFTVEYLGFVFRAKLLFYFGSPYANNIQHFY